MRWFRFLKIVMSREEERLFERVEQSRRVIGPGLERWLGGLLILQE